MKCSSCGDEMVPQFSAPSGGDVWIHIDGATGITTWFTCYSLEQGSFLNTRANLDGNRRVQPAHCG